MGKVSVKFFGAIIDIAKRQTVNEIDASNLRQLFDKLSESLGSVFRQRILDSTGQPQTFVNIFLNDKDIRHLSGLDTPLNDGDEILILPAIAGG